MTPQIQVLWLVPNINLVWFLKSGWTQKAFRCVHVHWRKQINHRPHAPRYWLCMEACLTSKEDPHFVSSIAICAQDGLQMWGCKDLPNLPTQTFHNDLIEILSGKITDLPLIKFLLCPRVPFYHPVFSTISMTAGLAITQNTKNKLILNNQRPLPQIWKFPN